MITCQVLLVTFANLVLLLVDLISLLTQSNDDNPNAFRQLYQLSAYTLCNLGAEISSSDCFAQVRSALRAPLATCPLCDLEAEISSMPVSLVRESQDARRVAYARPAPAPPLCWHAHPFIPIASFMLGSRARAHTRSSVLRWRSLTAGRTASQGGGWCRCEWSSSSSCAVRSHTACTVTLNGRTWACW